MGFNSAFKGLTYCGHMFFTYNIIYTFLQATYIFMSYWSFEELFFKLYCKESMYSMFKYKLQNCSLNHFE
jgi:hypothetical protein